MKTRRQTWKLVIAGWRQALAIALPIFIFAMWFGVHRGYSDWGLFAAVMAVGAWHIAELVVILCQRMRMHRRQSEESLMPDPSPEPAPIERNGGKP
jgi:hypothetical protein